MATLQMSLFTLDTDVTTATAPTTYYIGTCGRCHHTQRTTADRTRVYGALRYVPCKLCVPGENSKGVSIEVHEIKATYHAGTKCDSRCMHATGHDCQCSCNGSNHGKYA